MINQKAKIDRLKPYTLSDKTKSAKVVDGSIDVYLCNYKNGKPQRRLFIKRLNVGDYCPGLDSYEEGDELHFLLLSSPNAYSKEQGFANISSSTIEILNHKDSHWKQFIEGIPNYLDSGNFENDIAQYYLFMQMKESIDIYAQYKVNKKIKEDNLRKISLMFSGKAQRDNIEIIDTNSVYFATSIVCRESKIDCIEYNDLSKFQKEHLDVDKISLLSGFNYRKIQLDQDWFRQDVGHLVCFEKDSGQAVACISKGKGKYKIYKMDGTSNTVYSKIANDLENYAYILYRPLPNKSLSVFDMLRFSISCIKQSNIVKILFLSLLTMLVSLAIPQINQYIYDILIPSQDYIGIYSLCSVLICILIGSTCFSIVKSFITFSVFSKTRYQLQEAIYDRMFRLKQAFIDKYEAADLALRGAGVSQFSSLNAQILSSLLSVCLSVIFLVQMYMYDSLLATAALLIVIVEVIVLFVFGNKQVQLLQSLTEISSEKSSVLFQLIRGITKLRVANAEEGGLKKYMEKHIQASKLNFKISLSSAFLSAVSVVFSLLTTLIFYVLISFNGFYISVGTLMAFSAAFGMFSAAVLQVPQCIIVVIQLIPVIRRLKPILEEVPEAYSGNTKIENLTGAIEVSHLSYSYSTNSKLILNDISFNVSPGEYVGIVGSTGCGKSTLLNLLLGFFKPTNGKIFYDNTDLEELDKLDLRKNFGVVLQDGAIVADSIINNITIAKPDSTLSEVNDVIKQVGLTDDIKKMPMGLETVLSEGSGQISGGQKQRVLIARALIGKPKILFFDEATSSLDNNTQKQISDNLAKMNITRIVIAHRLSTIMNCDKIMVINDGKIIEKGTYEELIDNKKHFYELARKQIL